MEALINARHPPRTPGPKSSGRSSGRIHTGEYGLSLGGPPTPRGLPFQRAEAERQRVPASRLQGVVTHKDSAKLSSSKASIAAAAAATASTLRGQAGPSASYPARGPGPACVPLRRAPTGIGEALPPRPPPSRSAPARQAAASGSPAAATRRRGFHTPPGLRASRCSRRDPASITDLPGPRPASRYHGHCNPFRRLVGPTANDRRALPDVRAGQNRERK